MTIDWCDSPTGSTKGGNTLVISQSSRAMLTGCLLTGLSLLTLFAERDVSPAYIGMLERLRGYVGVKLSSANVARVLVKQLYLAEISQYWRVTQ